MTGKPDAGEAQLETLARELDEELGVEPLEPQFLAHVEAMAALERTPMKLTVFEARIGQVPEPAAELAALRWVSGHERDVRLAPAVRNHVLPLLRQRGSMAS
ncbi:NUDIX domain-containing protein [Streptomyces sp. NPDC055239]